MPLGTLLVLVGYFTGERTELAGAVVLTAGMWTVALLTWRTVRVAGPDRVTRLLLAVSAGVLAATMVLALSWALGEATGLPHPTLTWMAATHGLGNALGFALCALLARHAAPGPHPNGRHNRMSTLTYPEVGATRLGPSRRATTTSTTVPRSAGEGRSSRRRAPPSPSGACTARPGRA